MNRRRKTISNINGAGLNGTRWPGDGGGCAVNLDSRIVGDIILAVTHTVPFRSFK